MDDDISCLQLGPDDLPLLLCAPTDLFDHLVDPAQAKHFLEDPRHLLFFAVDGSEVVGFVSGTILLHPDKPPSLFVNEVGVREAWRRKGIGRVLVENIIKTARGRGCGNFWLATEPDNAAALALYRSLDGEEIGAVCFGWNGAFDT